MVRFFGQSGMIIALCYLSIYTNDSTARTLKGTIKGGVYFAPDNRFSFLLPPNRKVEEKARVIPVSHFYQRAFYPVPLDIEIPRKSEWLTISFVDSRGLSNEIHSMLISGDVFAPVAPGLHRRTASRFLQDLALPAWRSSVSSETWLAEGEYLNLDGMDALMTNLLVPAKDVTGILWKPEGARYHLLYATLVFIRGNHIYMLVQSAFNYRLPRPESFIDSKKSLQELYRAITFNDDSSLGTASIASEKGVQ